VCTLRVVVFALLSSAAAPAFAQTATRCDGPDAAKLVALSPREWVVACLKIDDTRRVIAAVPLAPLKAPATGGGAGPLVLKMALAKGDQIAWREERRLAGDAPEDVREVLDKSEEWLVGIDEVSLGGTPALRVGVVGHWGSDPMSVREIAFLYRAPADGAPARVWSGLGNRRESRAEYCFIEGVASFQLIDDKTLERQLRMTSSINHETKLPRRRARELEKKCVAKPEPPRRFSLNP
jgi:hypothetical protein